jgi:hypothetical protein
MPQFTGTYDAFDARGLREDLADDIFRVTPSDTPFVSAIGRGTAKGVFHEWQTHALASVDTANAQIEGDEFTYSDPAATVRVGNRTQILRKTYLISNTLEAVDKAGRDSEIAFNRVAKGLELRRDIEAMCIGKNAASVTGNGTTARVSGSLSSWLTSNDNGTPGASPASRGTSGGAGGFTSGNTAAATDGTVRAFTQGMLDGVIGRMYDNSGMVDDVIGMAGRVQKTAWTNFDGIASQIQTNTKDRVIMATADVYASQFGNIKIMPNRYIRQTSSVDREVYLVRPAYAKLAVLRPIQEMRPAITGDAEKRVLLTECTLQVDNEAAHGVIADLS